MKTRVAATIMTAVTLTACSLLAGTNGAAAKDSYIHTHTEFGVGGQFSQSTGSSAAAESSVMAPVRIRFGERSGIGASSFQTTAATSDSMPDFRQRTNSFSPAFTSIHSAVTHETPTFSSRILSPALTQTTIMPPTFSTSGQINPQSFESGRPQMMSGSSYMLYGLSPAQSGGPERSSLSAPTSADDGNL